MSEPRIETQAEAVNASTKGITLRIMTWNVDGFNDPAKRLAVVSYLWEQKVDIATVTESHLLDDDIFTDPGEGEERIMKIQLDHYRVARRRNREPTDVGGCLSWPRQGSTVRRCIRDLCQIDHLAVVQWRWRRLGAVVGRSA